MSCAKTVAYGQFSMFSNEWMGIKDARQIDYEVSSFYFDLDNSIKDVASSVKRSGKSIYIVGNRRAKNIQLPTDQFIAEKFEECDFRHLFTYKRMLGNKVVPFKNSPTNKV